MVKEINKYNTLFQFKSGGLWKKKIFKKNYKSRPLITIITVTLNSEKYLKETLKSIFNQSYQNYELIIIDGESKDKTLKIIKKNEKKIDYWISKKDKGIYDAFNKGLSLARGELIGFVNSDDILKKNALKILIKYNSRYQHSDFFFGSVKKHWGVLYGYSKWKIYYTWSFYSGHSTGFFIRKNAAKKVGKYNLKYKYHADWDYFFRMIVKHKLFGIGTKKNEIFGIFRRGGFSSKLDYFNHFIETIRIRKNNGQNRIMIFVISYIKFLFNRHRFNNKKILFLLLRELF